MKGYDDMGKHEEEKGDCFAFGGNSGDRFGTWEDYEILKTIADEFFVRCLQFDETELEKVLDANTALTKETIQRLRKALAARQDIRLCLPGENA